jgi:hypothetical protein
MKSLIMLFRIFILAMLCTGITLSCRKTGSNENPPNPGGGGSNPTADSLSNHLTFLKATKKQGLIPKAPSASSLKVSFEDTLFLADQVKGPIKFQHLDTSQNVAGIFLQVDALIGGPLEASYYYDIPEVPQLDSSDTVSVILVGIDPTGIKLPLSFNVTIVPYNSSGQPIAQAVRPVKIIEHTTDPKSNNSCGLVLPTGEVWDWDFSYIQSPQLDFYSNPDKVWGGEGQDILGSCCNGISIYGNCPGVTLPNTSLHFDTYYQIMSEQLIFNDDGTYFRKTTEIGTTPLPDSSNFCDPFAGLVHPFLNTTLFFGNYTVTPATIPPDLQNYHDSLKLSLQIISVTPKGGGFGNPGGIIHLLNCKTGDLRLIQVDLEGFQQHLYKFYKRKSVLIDKWFKF